MKITRIPNKRNIDYYVDLLSDDQPKVLYTGSNYTGVKLDIKKRHIKTDLGEVNFLIRDNTNNLKYLILYGFMNEPDKIFEFRYYINDKVKMDDFVVATVENLMDEEVAKYFILDFINNYVSKKYTII